MKKFVALLLTLSLLCACTLASACAYTPRSSAVKTATVSLAVASVNAAVKTMVHIAQKTPYDDARLVQMTTDALCNATVKKAASVGVTVECTKDIYQIDGHEVAIDPLKVINLH